MKRSVWIWPGQERSHIAGPAFMLKSSHPPRLFPNEKESVMSLNVAVIVGSLRQGSFNRAGN